RPTARIGAKIRHSCGPPPRGFRRVSLQSLREQFDSPPSLKLRRTAFVSTGLPAEAAKQRGLVGGSGIEPLTPSMSRKFPAFATRLLRIVLNCKVVDLMPKIGCPVLDALAHICLILLAIC